MTRVVTLTSIAVERDSRAYKFAASAARLGHESIVVEGEPSQNLSGDLPFELRSPPQGNVNSAAIRAGAPEVPGPSVLTRIAERLPGPLGSAFGLIARPVNGLLIHPLRNTRYTLRAAAHDLRSRTEETAELLPDADVYSLHGFWQYGAVREKLKQNDARLLYDIHDALWEQGMNVAETLTQRAVLRRYEAIDRRCARAAKGFSTVSAGVAGLLEQRFGRRPDVIRNAHDLRIDGPARGDVREACGAGPDDFLLVMTGNWKSGHVIEEALTALQALPERVQLAFVGREHERSEPLVAKWGLEDRVHLLGPRPPTEIVNFISSADASPILYREETLSYKYSLPNGFFHAIAAGLPVLYPNLDEMRALGEEHGLGILFEPDDPESIAAAIRGLLDDPEAAARYRANVEKARTVLNWEHEERILAGMLERALSPASL